MYVNIIALSCSLIFIGTLKLKLHAQHGFQLFQPNRYCCIIRIGKELFCSCDTNSMESSLTAHHNGLVPSDPQMCPHKDVLSSFHFETDMLRKENLFHFVAFLFFQFDSTCMQLLYYFSLHVLFTNMTLVQKVSSAETSFCQCLMKVCIPSYLPNYNSEFLLQKWLCLIKVLKNCLDPY